MRPLTPATLALALAAVGASLAQDPPAPLNIPASPRYEAAAQAALAEPFRGITSDGTIRPGLFAVSRTGLSLRPVVDAAAAFLASLDAEQRARASYAVDDAQWRRWSNIHRFPREGVAFGEMTPGQSERGMALLRASLGLRGFENARDIMRLNETIAEMTGRRAEYGEGRYWLTVMGTPGEREPWGWQLDGHHLVVNYFVLGDQVVMTPTFMGSEPVRAEAGKYAGTRVFEDEEARGLAFVRGLDPPQRARAVISTQMPRDVFATAFRDNLRLPYEGLPAKDLTGAQRRDLLALVGLYVASLPEGHARLRMAEVERHLGETYFAWIGPTGDDAVFYYRVHSPVILVEFDHQRGVALAGDTPSRNHVHTVVRTPNGNDYGRDLLRQHHRAYDHSRPGTGHRH